MKDTKINVLGTEYTIEYVTEEKMCELMLEQGCGGCCGQYTKAIHISTLNHCAETKETIEETMKISLRHEIIHAFLNESGLSENGNNVQCWSKNEEMVDWIAIQFPKILKVYQELDIL